MEKSKSADDSFHRTEPGRHTTAILFMSMKPRKKKKVELDQHKFTEIQWHGDSKES